MYYRLQHLSIHKLNPEHTSIGQPFEVNTFREAIKHVFFKDEVDLDHQDISDMMVGWVEYADKFVCDYNEELQEILFKLPR